MKNLLNKILYTKYYILNTRYRLAIFLACYLVIAVSVSVLAQSLPRFFVIEFTAFKDGTAVFNSVKLLQGDEPIFPESDNGYSFKLRDLAKNVIAQKTFNFDFKSEVDTDKGYLPVDINRIDGFARIPYAQNAETLELTDPLEKVLAKVYLKDYICVSDGLCPSICRETGDNDCRAQGKCGDGMCQTRYENEQTCALDCAISNQFPQEPISQPKEPIRPDDFNNRNINGFIIFLITLIIVALGVYAYLLYKRHHKT